MSCFPQNVHATLKPEKYGCKITCQNQSSDAFISVKLSSCSLKRMRQLRAHEWHMEHCSVVLENQLNNFCCTNRFTQCRSDRLQMLGNTEITNLTRIQCKSFLISNGCEKQAWAHSPNVQSDPSTSL